MDKYSVLMSVYVNESPENLKMSINSMLKKTIVPDEIVIVKDGELTLELDNILLIYLKTYPHIIKVLSIKKNVGLGLALNLGLQHCNNELVARMDTDDISLPQRCEKQLKKFEEMTELDIVGTMVDEFYEDPTNIVSKRVVPVNHDEIYRFAKRRSPFNHPTVMYKKSKVLECRGYSDLRRNQDVDLFGRMLFHGAKGANLSESLLLFRSNNKLSQRRKSWLNTKSYISTIRLLWKIGYSSFFDYLIVTIGQIVIFISPIKLQNWIYKYFLRKSIFKKA
jgi:glycosyltransferase involved in cell wall biosynthesis